MDAVESLRIYARVAELASFTAAAESLGLPKATVSTAVQRLEAHLGTRLLHRTTRRVAMTQDGRVVYERGRDLVADVEELASLFRGEGPVSGRLRVDMPLAIARDVVLPRLPELLADHPALEIEIGSTDRRVDLVREGFDCVLRVGAVGDATLIARPVGAYRMVNCASPDYLARRGVPRTPSDLASHRLVHYLPQFGARSTGFEYVDPDDPARERTLAMAGTITVNNSDAYVAACLAGLGLIQVPEAGMIALLEAGRLVRVMDRFRPAPMPVSIVYANRRQLPRRVRVFMDWIAAIMQPRLAARPRRAATGAEARVKEKGGKAR
jgi:DNA-binding transcriptional LysR family regulator